MIHDYNCNMNGVNVFDQKMENYNTNGKYNRCSFKLSLFIINIFLNNLYILYIDKKMGYCSRLEFGLKISKYMCTKGETNSGLRKSTFDTKNGKTKKTDDLCESIIRKRGKTKKTTYFTWGN
ncbi:hypothetical protein CDIK_0588 [Cucumispora dikerogammari]|nr:hypothetical protein CDIK_0588 [Cucumispora dikerogammari]